MKFVPLCIAFCAVLGLSCTKAAVDEIFSSVYYNRPFVLPTQRKIAVTKNYVQTKEGARADFTQFFGGSWSGMITNTWEIEVYDSSGKMLSNIDLQEIGGLTDTNKYGIYLLTDTACIVGAIEAQNDSALNRNLLAVNLRTGSYVPLPEGVLAPYFRWQEDTISRGIAEAEGITLHISVSRSKEQIAYQKVFPNPDGPGQKMAIMYKDLKLGTAKEITTNYYKSKVSMYMDFD